MSSLLAGRARPLVLPDQESEMTRKAGCELSQFLADGGDPLTVRVEKTNTGVHVDLIIPSAALTVLADVLANMAAGSPVFLIPIHSELSTQQAADLLNG